MNPLERQVAEYLAKAGGQTLPPEVVVKDFAFESLRGEPDYLLAWLSNGQILTVQWDTMNSRVRLKLGDEDAVSDVDVKASAVPINQGKLADLIRLVEDKYERWVAEDTDTYDQGNCEEN